VPRRIFGPQRKEVAEDLRRLHNGRSFINLRFAIKHLGHIARMGEMRRGKVVPVLNKEPCHENALGSGGIASSILDLGTRCRSVVIFTPRPPYPRERYLGTHWIRSWVGPRAVLQTVVRRKIPSLPGNRTLARSLFALQIELSRF
jgi:hypothetical protein